MIDKPFKPNVVVFVGCNHHAHTISWREHVGHIYWDYIPGDAGHISRVLHERHGERFVFTNENHHYFHAEVIRVWRKQLADSESSQTPGCT